MTPQDKARLLAVRERVEKATPGSWWWEYSHSGDPLHLKADGDVDVMFPSAIRPFAISRDNQRFIAHSRVDIDWLLALVQRQEEEIERLRSYFQTAEEEITLYMPDFDGNQKVVGHATVAVSQVLYEDNQRLRAELKALQEQPE